jgi:MSHA biogenesis protein MshQ
MACQAALTGMASVNLGYSCINPSSCSASSPAAGLLNITPYNGTTAQAPQTVAPASSSVNLYFDTNGNAPFTLNYLDAGQIMINASKAASGALLTALAGSSNTFTTKPGGFVLSLIQQTASPYLANPAAVNAGGAIFVKAGEPFSVTVTATITGGSAATPNFGNELPSTIIGGACSTCPESVQLAPTLVAPAGGDLGTLSGKFGAFSNGVAIADGVSTLPDGTKSIPYSWNEVGIITLAPSLLSGNYMGWDPTNSGLGNVTGTASGNVGRFYPAQFAVSGGAIVNRADISTCTGSVCPFAYTYMGEQMNTVFTLTAQALDGVTTTKNYTYSSTSANNFAMLNPLATVAAYSSGPLGLGVIDTNTPRTPFAVCAATPAQPCFTPSVATAGSFSSGVATNVTVPLTIYRGTTGVGPFTALNIAIAPADSDGVTTVYNLDTVNVVAGANNHTQVGSSAVRYGRTKISNASGSPLLQLPVSLTAQYWTNNGYITSADDNNSVLTLANLALGAYLPNTWTTSFASLTNKTVTATASNPVPVPAYNGTWFTTLSIPSGLSGRGSVPISTMVQTAPYITPSYLPSTTGLATFGIYTGNKNLIYMRENY